MNPKPKVPAHVSRLAREAYIMADQHGGYWHGEHPKYRYQDWLYEVRCDQTRTGYWEWCAAQESDQ
jgi:hypothetical protein